MGTIKYSIPAELTELIESCTINSHVDEWEKLCELICPFPEQHMLLSTNTPNNTIILAAKICVLLGINLNEFKMFTPINDIYDPERNHGIYTHNNKYFYMDMKRIRYDDYKYMIRILESIIYSQRINITHDTNSTSIKETNTKIMIIINNFDMILQQYLKKFIKYAETLSVNVSFIYIGSGIINYYSKATKLKGLCIVKRCMFTKLSHGCNIDEHQICDMLYNFTDGDLIKSWLILQIFNNDVHANALLPQLTKMQLFTKYILPNLPILNSIYELLIVLRATINNKTYSITPIMNKLYILHSYPDMNICQIITMIFKLFVFIHNHDTNHKLYLSHTNITEFNKLCIRFTAMETITPYVFNEPILILRGFITKLLLFLAV